MAYSIGMKSVLLNFLSLSAILLLQVHDTLPFPLSERDAGTTVSTAQGDVTGTLTSPRVRQFLGIPYASAVRWTAPAAPPSRSSTFSATQFGTTCTQSTAASVGEILSLSGAGTAGVDGNPLTQGDSCLTANIWSPSTDRPQGTAVMVWIYGGSFEFGTSNFPIYVGQNIVDADDDVTVVTFNYRMNIFGQPNAPQFNVPGQAQNFGLLDIATAIEWVHANIAGFGGDPDRITLFGQSAGSAAIDAYVYAQAAAGNAPIINGIIMESGTLDLILSVPIGKIGTDQAAVNDWNKVAAAVGCGSQGDAAQLACMRAVDSNALESAIQSTGTSFAVIVDDVTIFSDTRARAAAGNFLHVPMLTGNTANEGDIFVVSEELLTLDFAVPGVTTVVSNALTQVAFVCPANTAVTDRVNAGVPTWRYQYDAVFPDISTRPDLRAYHASEIPIVFGTYNDSTAAGPTPVEIALSSYIQSAWVAFARNPSSGLLSGNFGWPEFGSSQSAVRLGNSANPAGKTIVPAATLDTACGTIDALVAVYNELGLIVSIL